MGWQEDLDQITRQERELVFESFDFDTAWELGSLIRATCLQGKLSVVIDVRRFGQPLFYTALEGTTPDNVDWVRRKSNVVARFHRSSYAIGMRERIKDANLIESQGLALSDYATHGGSFPITVGNAGVIGSVTVSGLPERQDHAVVVDALCRMLGRSSSDLRLPD